MRNQPGAHADGRPGRMGARPAGADEAPRYRRPPSPARTSSARPWTGASPRWRSRRSARWPRSRSTSSPTPPSSGGWAREPLAGLALAASVLLFVTSLCSFLAYGTTPRVARARGAERPGRAPRRSGVQSLWLGVLLGLPLAAALALFARPVVQLLGGEGAALDAAVTYLRISAIGVPFVLLALVGAGVFRGVADLRTPLAIVFTASVVNLVLEIVAVYGLDLGIAGSAWSTVVVQIAAAGRLPAAHAPPPGRRAVPPARPGRAGQPRPVGEPPRAAGRLADRRLRHRHRGRRPHRHDHRRRAPGRQHHVHPARARHSTPSPSRPRPWWPRRSGAGDAGLARRVGERVLVLSVVVGGGLSARRWPRWRRSWRGCSAATRRSSSRVTAGLVVLAVLLLPGSVAFALDGVLIGAGDVRFLGRAMVIALVDLRALRRPAAGLTRRSGSSACGRRWRSGWRPGRC